MKKLKYIKVFEDKDSFGAGSSAGEEDKFKGFTYDQIAFLKTHVVGGKLKKDKWGKDTYSHVDAEWTLNEDGTLDVKGSVLFQGFNYDSLKGLKFGTIDGNFSCKNNLFKTLAIGFPKKVTGYFDCSGNQLHSLEGAPIDVVDFDCKNNYLVTLEHCPEHIKGEFNCGSNKLTNLKFGPTKVDGNYKCKANYLSSLRGSPDIIEGSFDCSDNELKSLKGGPRIVKYEYAAEFNNLETINSGCDEVKNFTISHSDPKVLIGLPKKIKEQFFYYFKYEDGRVEGFTVNDRNPENGGWFDDYIMDENNSMHSRRLMFTTLEANEVNKRIKRYPGLVIMFLKDLWNIKEYEVIKKDIVIPEEYKESFDIVTGLKELGF